MPRVKSSVRPDGTRLVVERTGGRPRCHAAVVDEREQLGADASPRPSSRRANDPSAPPRRTARQPGPRGRTPRRTGSSSTGTRAVGGFAAPNSRTARWTDSSAIDSHASSSSPRAIAYENPVCVSSPSVAIDTATHHASVLAYSADTPAVDAIATREAESPIWARSILVTRGSIEIVRRSRSSASATLRSAGIVGLIRTVELGHRLGTARTPGSTLCSSGSASEAFSRARSNRLADFVDRRIRHLRVAEPAAADQADADDRATPRT